MEIGPGLGRIGTPSWDQDDQGSVEIVSTHRMYGGYERYKLDIVYTDKRRDCPAVRREISRSRYPVRCVVVTPEKVLSRPGCILWGYPKVQGILH
jgi:hypothetical protein